MGHPRIVGLSNKRNFMDDAIVTEQIPEVSEVSRPGRLASLTIADGLLVMVVILAAVGRLVELGATPLSPAEAGQALTVWNFWHVVGLNQAIVPISPAYFALTSLLSQVMGSNEATMRLLPALFGLGLVALPWLWQRRLGQLGALITSLLLAVSPLFSFASRTAGGDSLALFAILLALVCFDNYQLSQEKGWFYGFVIAIALGLNSSPLFYGAVATLALAWLVQYLMGPKLYGELLRPEPTLSRSALTMGTILFVGLGTMFLWNPAGLGGTAGLLGSWFANFGLNTDITVWLSPLLALARYESAIFMVGLIAIIWATWRNDNWSVFMVYWFSAGIILLLLQSGKLENGLLLLLPMALLTGLWCQRQLEAPAGASKWLLYLFLLLVGLTIYFNLVRYLRVSQYDPNQFGYAGLAIIALVLGLAAINLVRTFDWAAGRQGSVWALLTLLLAYSWGSGWWLNHQAANDPRERWVSEATANDLPLLRQVLQDTSRQLSNSARSLEIFSAVDTPVIRWYLRDFDQVSFGDSVPAEAQQQAIITHNDITLTLPNDYFGADFRLRNVAASQPSEPAAQPLTQILRWWFLRQSSATVEQESIILWVKAQ